MSNITARMFNLNDNYQYHLKEAVRLSKKITEVLHEHYNDEILATFKDRDEFLEHLNEFCDGGSTGKLLFIKEVDDKRLINLRI